MNHPFVVSLSNHKPPSTSSGRTDLLSVHGSLIRSWFAYPFVVRLSVRGEPVEPQTPFDKLRANGFIVRSWFTCPFVVHLPVRGSLIRSWFAYPFVVSLSNHESPVRGEPVEPHPPLRQAQGNGMDSSLLTASKCQTGSVKQQSTEERSPP